MINYTFWDNDYNEILLQKEVQHTREEIQEMALEFFNNYEEYRVDDDYNYCENFIQYLVAQKGFSFPKVDNDNVYDIYLLKRLSEQEEEKNNCLENIKTTPKVDTTDISNTFMNCSIITELPKLNIEEGDK